MLHQRGEDEKIFGLQKVLTKIKLTDEVLAGVGGADGATEAADEKKNSGNETCDKFLETWYGSCDEI